MAPGSVSGSCKRAYIHRYVWQIPGIDLSITLVRRARRNPHFDPPKVGDRPPTGELRAPLHHTLS